MDTSNIWYLVASAGGLGFLISLLISLIGFRIYTVKVLTKELRERKDQFISLASHYLLNPITIIQTAVTSLQERDTNLTTEQRMQFYDAIERGQRRLWIVTQQLILVGEIDQGNLQLHTNVANLYETVSDAISAVDPFARAKQIKIHYKDNTKDVREARFDERRMKQAMIAVIDNAIKFSLENSEIFITLSWESGVFSVVIEDSGIGMPDEILAHISEKFYRGTQTYTFDYEGLGLGLHIAQAIAHMHEGNISFTSKPKKGTLAAIQFPNL